MIPATLAVIGKRYKVEQKTEDGDYGECFSDDCRIEIRVRGNAISSKPTHCCTRRCTR